MNTETVFRLLHNAGFNNLGADDAYIYMEDPACITRSFETFFEYAWIILIFITGIMLAGWAWAMIRGSKNAEFNSIANNLKNLVLILGVISATPVLINFIYGGDLIGQACKTIAIPLETIDKLLAQRYEELAKHDEYNLYENFEIYDSGAIEQQQISVSTSEPAPQKNPENMDIIATTKITETEIHQPAPRLAPSASPNMTPIRAIESGNDVIFVATDGQEYKHIGGTRAWRNNNPGNIRMSEFSKRMGAIGSAGGFAVFPNEQTGSNAVKQLLRSKNYQNKTIAGAISRYAPPSENNTAAYNNSIARLTGLDINRSMSTLTEQELDNVVNAIRQIEGWKPGKIEKI